MTTIGEAAQRTGLPVKTIRYYEGLGLVTASRQANGYRDYDARALHTLAFLGRARSLGFSLEECRSLVSLWQDEGRASADVRSLAQQKLREIDARMAALEGLRGTLARLVDRCHGDDRPDCPILEDLGRFPARPSNG